MIEKSIPKTVCFLMPTAIMSQHVKKDKNTAIMPAIKVRKTTLVLLSRRTIVINMMIVHIK